MSRAGRRCRYRARRCAAARHRPAAPAPAGSCRGCPAPAGSARQCSRCAPPPDDARTARRTARASFAPQVWLQKCQADLGACGLAHADASAHPRAEVLHAQGARVCLRGECGLVVRPGSCAPPRTAAALGSPLRRPPSPRVLCHACDARPLAPPPRARCFGAQGKEGEEGEGDYREHSHDNDEDDGLGRDDDSGQEGGAELQLRGGAHCQPVPSSLLLVVAGGQSTAARADSVAAGAPGTASAAAGADSGLACAADATNADAAAAPGAPSGAADAADAAADGEAGAPGADDAPASADMRAGAGGASKAGRAGALAQAVPEDPSAGFARRPAEQGGGNGSAMGGSMACPGAGTIVACTAPYSYAYPGGPVVMQPYAAASAEGPQQQQAHIMQQGQQAQGQYPPQVYAQYAPYQQQPTLVYPQYYQQPQMQPQVQQQMQPMPQHFQQPAQPQVHEQQQPHQEQQQSCLATAASAEASASHAHQP